MYYKYHNNEESFLSAYTACKLREGGAPVITKKELQSVLEKFLNSYHYNSSLTSIKNFKFDNLEVIAKNFQNIASENRSWLKPCFIYKDEKLYPTYSFFDFTSENYEFASFLCGITFKKTTNLTDIEKCDDTIKKSAKIAAKYITKYFAKKYIEKETEKGRWPNHLTDISYIFNDDLGKVLKLEGTKKYFSEFYCNVYSMLASMLKNNNKQLKLTDQRYGNLEYNNLKRILSAYPTLDNLCTTYYSNEKRPKKFNMTIINDSVKVNETELVYSDPYGDFSDEYSNKKIDLTEK